MSVEKKVIDIVKELSGCETIYNNSMLTSELGLDSLGMVMLIIGLEDNFDIRLDESDMDPFNLKTVEDVTELVCKYLGV